MGIINGQETELGLKASYVRRQGAGVNRHSVGDRVAIIRYGTFVNRIQVPGELMHLLPG
jgi:NADPH:quinone reductase-like Zn-dependent oxidoreductase